MNNDIQGDAAAVLEGQEVLQMVAAGATLQEVADSQGYSVTTAWRRYHAQLAAASKVNHELGAMQAAQDLESLRQLLQTWMPRALGTSEDEEGERVWGKDQEGAAKVVLGILDRRAKLTGADAAIKHDISVGKVDEAVERVAAALAAAGSAELIRYTKVPDGEG